MGTLRPRSKVPLFLRFQPGSKRSNVGRKLQHRLIDSGAGFLRVLLQYKLYPRELKRLVSYETGREGWGEERMRCRFVHGPLFDRKYRP